MDLKRLQAETTEIATKNIEALAATKKKEEAAMYAAERILEHVRRPWLAAQKGLMEFGANNDADDTGESRSIVLGEVEFMPPHGTELITRNLHAVVFNKYGETVDHMNEVSVYYYVEATEDDSDSGIFTEIIPFSTRYVDDEPISLFGQLVSAETYSPEVIPVPDKYLDQYSPDATMCAYQNPDDDSVVVNLRAKWVEAHTPQIQETLKLLTDAMKRTAE